MTNETLELRKLQKELRIANAIIEKMLKEAEEEKESEKQQKCLEERISTILSCTFIGGTAIFIFRSAVRLMVLCAAPSAAASAII